MKKFISAIAASVIAASSVFAIDLSKFELADKPAPAPAIEHNLPHIEWDADAHNKFFDLVMTQVMSNDDLDPQWTTPMIVDAVKCMDESFSSDYTFASFLGNWATPSDEFNIEVELTTEICFTAAFMLHSAEETEIKYY